MYQNDITIAFIVSYRGIFLAHFASIPCGLLMNGIDLALISKSEREETRLRRRLARTERLRRWYVIKCISKILSYYYECKLWH